MKRRVVFTDAGLTRRVWVDDTQAVDLLCGPLVPATLRRQLDADYRRLADQGGGRLWITPTMRIDFTIEGVDDA